MCDMQVAYTNLIRKSRWDWAFNNLLYYGGLTAIASAVYLQFA